MDEFLAAFDSVSEHRPWNEWEWFIKIRNPFGDLGHFNLEPTFLGCEIEYLFIALLTFIHAWNHGKENLWVWATTVTHGLFVELVSYFVEPIDNFWHAQGTIQLFGQREPIHIIFLYPCFIYPAWIAMEKIGVKGLSRCAGVALFTLMNDLPYDIIGVKLLWWVWHDTDPNIYDRHLWVPWGSYYFHLTFAFSFTLLYTNLKKVCNGQFWPTFLTSVLSMPLGCVQFTPLFHFGKDVFGIHSSITTGILVAIYLLIFAQGLYQAKPAVSSETTSKLKNPRFDEVVFAEIVHFSHYLALVMFADPKSLQVLGLHQPMGSAPGSGDKYDCLQMKNLTYPYPMTVAAPFEELKGPYDAISVWKRPYICENGDLVDEAYYDFNCAAAKNQQWVPGNMWYWICGTDWNDSSGLTRADYVLVVSAACVLGLSAYLWALCLPKSPWFYLKTLSFPSYEAMKQSTTDVKPRWETIDRTTEDKDLTKSPTPRKSTPKASPEAESKEEEADEVSSDEDQSETSHEQDQINQRPETRSTSFSTQTRYNLRKRKPRQSFA